MNAAYANKKRAARDHAAASPVSYVRFTPALEQNMPVGVYRLALLFWVFFLMTFAMTFWGSGHTRFVLAICTAYAVMFFGTPYVLWRQAKKMKPKENAQGLDLADFLRRDLATLNGPMHGRDALIQVVLVPALLCLGCIAIGIIINLARTGAY